MVKELTSNVEIKDTKKKVIETTSNNKNNEVTNSDGEVDETDESMMELLGFSGFATTKGQQVDDNVKGASAGTAAKHKKRVYRQYMNRRGGFNRPLQKID